MNGRHFYIKGSAFFHTQSRVKKELYQTGKGMAMIPVKNSLFLCLVSQWYGM